MLTKIQYTSPERANKDHRNTKCDIFSLACVYAEIFTVYKGRSIEDFLAYRKKADPDGYFHKPEVMSEVLTWLDDLATERCDVQVVRLLRKMFSFEPKERPDAETVWKVLTACTTTDSQYFCGPCCMPLARNDPLLAMDLQVEPSRTKYSFSSSISTTEPLKIDSSFGTNYQSNLPLRLRWERNLRLWSRSILDVVQTDHPHFLARKRIFAPGDEQGPLVAHNEADILNNVKHKHIVQLHGTYRQGDIFGLLFEPAADYDLRSYLALAEVCNTHTAKTPIDIDFLTKGFGCLANALACVHAAGYDHGDISPENILVHNRRIYLSKFSFGLKLEDPGSSGPNNQRLHRMIDMLGSLSLQQGKRRPLSGTDGQPRQQASHSILTGGIRPAHRKQPGPYQPPEWQSTCVGQPAADIFALGCVFIEIYTVLCGQRIQKFEEFRVKNGGQIGYSQSLRQTSQWLSELKFDKLKDWEKFHQVLQRMIDPKAENRPKATEVAETMRGCETTAGMTLIGDC